MSDRYISATDEHVHATPPGAAPGRVRGFRLVGYEFTGREVETIWVKDGPDLISITELAERVRPYRVEVVAFPVIDGCCDLWRGN